MKLIVNIPVYNEEDKIGKTIDRIRKSFENEFYVSGLGAKITEKLIQVIDDGSTDRSAEISREKADLIVSYMPNRRLAYSFKQAVGNALDNRADLMVNIDADGQFDPEDIPKLLGPILEGKSDMVIANRFDKYQAENIPWIRSFLNQLAAKMVGFFLGTRTSDLTCGFRAHNRETLLRLNLSNTTFTYTQETLIDAIGKNLKVSWVPVPVKYFGDRKGKITRSLFEFVTTSAKIMFPAIRDVQPFKFFGLPGLILILIGVIDGIWFLFHYFQDFKITPFRNHIIFLSVAIAIGIQLLIFALIADMIKANRKLTEDLMYRIRKKDIEK